MLGQLRQESRGVAAESTKFRDYKGNEADVWATPRPLLNLMWRLSFNSFSVLYLYISFF
jgi:hypothetical protein